MAAVSLYISSAVTESKPSKKTLCKAYFESYRSAIEVTFKLQAEETNLAVSANLQLHVRARTYYVAFFCNWVF